MGSKFSKCYQTPQLALHLDILNEKQFQYNNFIQKNKSMSGKTLIRRRGQERIS